MLVTLISRAKHPDVFNVRHLIPYVDDNSSCDDRLLNSRVNLADLKESDVARIEFDFMDRLEHSKA